jgi:hypothetical protein
MHPESKVSWQRDPSDLFDRAEEQAIPKRILPDNPVHRQFVQVFQQKLPARIGRRRTCQGGLMAEYRLE